MLVSILFPLLFYDCNENKLKINIPPYGENLMLTYWDKNWNLEGLHYLSILPLRNNWMDFRFSEKRDAWWVDALIRVVLARVLEFQIKQTIDLI